MKRKKKDIYFNCAHDNYINNCIKTKGREKRYGEKIREKILYELKTNKYSY